MNQFLKEILEQPDAIQRTLDYYTGEEGLASLARVKKQLTKGDFKYIVFTGMGSSYFTSFAAANLFNTEKIAPSFVINASELLHYNLSLLDKPTLLVCFSQSGESFEIKELLRYIPASTYCVGIMNSEESTLAKRADTALFSKSGKEEMTSTKTFISTKLVAYILGWYLSDNWNQKQRDKIQKMIGQLRQLLEGSTLSIQKALTFLGGITAIQIIARGATYASASQSALMFKEANKIAGTGMLGGEFRHGPMEMVKPGFQSILFAAKGKTYPQSIKMATDIAEFEGKVWLITNGDETPENDRIYTTRIDQPDEYLFSIASILPVQLFVDAYAKMKGFEAGSFSRGAKVTEIE